MLLWARSACRIPSHTDRNRYRVANKLYTNLLRGYSSNLLKHKYITDLIKDKKKEHTLNLYYHSIAPKLIKLIHKEII